MKGRFTYEMPSPTATSLVGLSHRGSRVETHAAAANRKIRRREASQCGQPYGGPGGVFAVVEQRDGHRPKVHYVFKDHLGSWTTVTDAYGQVIAEQSFDAWGNPRNPNTWLNYSAPELAEGPMFDRGFTGHEHLTAFGLINMNGRMYDPVMSSFLSVDNYVQNPDFSQNFNRYAYCYNNPLKYTDPDGEWIQILIGAVIGGVTNLAINWGKIDTFGEGLAYFGIGAAAGALSTVTGGAAAGAIKLGGFVSGAATGAVTGATSGFITGAGNAWMQGANFGQGLWTGIKQGGISAGIGGLTGGLMEGWMDWRNGYKFWDGTKQIGEPVTVDAIEKTPELMPYDPETLGDLDCAPATLSWTDRSLGGDMSMWEAKGVVAKGPNGGCLGEASVDNYCKATNRTYAKRSLNLSRRQRCAEVFSEIKDGNRVILDVHGSDAGMSHFVGVKSVTKTHLISSKGFDVSRYSFSIMDPSYSSYINQNSRYVGNAIRAFYIRP